MGNDTRGMPDGWWQTIVNNRHGVIADNGELHTMEMTDSGVLKSLN